MMLRIWNMEWLKFRKQMMEIMLLYLVERTQLSVKGANVEASWKFLTWITSKEESAKICEAIGRYSPRADVDVQEMYKDDPLNATFAE